MPSRAKKHNKKNIDGVIKEKRLEIRTSHLTISRLAWLSSESEKFKGMSATLIIETLIDDAIMLQELYTNKRFK